MRRETKFLMISIAFIIFINMLFLLSIFTQSPNQITGAAIIKISPFNLKTNLVATLLIMNLIALLIMIVVYRNLHYHY